MSSNPSREDLDNLLKDFKVKDDDDLRYTLLNDWDKVECYICHKKISITNADFSDELPKCKFH